MTSSSLLASGLIVGAVLAASIGAGPALAQTPAQPAQQDQKKSSPLGGLGSNSKEPIKIDADRLEVFDRENRAVYSGNVVAVQGDTTMRCSALTIFFERQRGQGGQGGQAAQAGQAGQAGGARTQRAAAGASSDGQNESIRRIECKGPVTVVSKDQIATGDDATYDRVAGQVVMTGNVAFSQGPNVTRGERLVYDLNAGIANIETKPGGRVQGLFVPGSGPDAAAQKPASPQQRQR